MKPSDVAIGPEDLLSTFGWYEFEALARQVITWLAGPGGDSWDTSFTVEQVGADSSVFTAACSCGWYHFDWVERQRHFAVSDAFIGRLVRKRQSRVS